MIAFQSQPSPTEEFFLYAVTAGVLGVIGYFVAYFLWKLYRAPYTIMVKKGSPHKNTVWWLSLIPGPLWLIGMLWAIAEKDYVAEERHFERLLRLSHNSEFGLQRFESDLKAYEAQVHERAKTQIDNGGSTQLN